MVHSGVLYISGRRRGPQTSRARCSLLPTHPLDGSATYVVQWLWLNANYYSWRSSAAHCRLGPWKRRWAPFVSVTELSRGPADYRRFNLLTLTIEPQIWKYFPCTRSLKFCTPRFKTQGNYIRYRRTTDVRTDVRQPYHKLDDRRSAKMSVSVYSGD